MPFFSAFKISEGLQYHLATTGDLKSALDGKVFNIYGSPTSQSAADALIPATASSGIGSATLLCTVSVSGLGTGVTFEDVPVNGAVVKTSAESWLGENLASGYASFYRLADDADSGLTSTTEIRTQGTVGTLGTDLIVGSAYLTLGSEQRIDSYAIGIPSE
jgi:hypothetical protein